MRDYKMFRNSISKHTYCTSLPKAQRSLLKGDQKEYKRQTPWMTTKKHLLAITAADTKPVHPSARPNLSMERGVIYKIPYLTMNQFTIFSCQKQ